ncbi:MAG: heme exporter protein CcmB [Armatimonadota bacterium]
MANSSSTWADGCWAILRKDIQSEFRTRYAFNAVVVFAVTTLAVVSYSAQVVGAGARLLSPLLWIIILFSAMSGLSRTFVREEDAGTANTLRLAADPTAVYVGKLLFNTVLLAVLNVLVVPLFLVLMDVSVGNLFLFVVILITGSTSIAATATFVAAIVSKASVRSALFAVLSFPLLVPVLVAAVQGTEASLRGASTVEGMPFVKILTAFAGAMVAVGLLLFEHVWDEV